MNSKKTNEEWTPQKQLQSAIWFKVRAGLVTASKFKPVCRTNVLIPSKGLLMNICYPRGKKISNAATAYGCQHEKKARCDLEKHLKSMHSDVKTDDRGLFRRTEFPFLGASPGGIMSCSCCNHCYAIEIKCPYKCSKMKINNLLSTDSSFHMQFDPDTNLYLLKRPSVFLSSSTADAGNKFTSMLFHGLEWHLLKELILTWIFSMKMS